MALNEVGCRAKSLLGFQIPVTTEATHTRAQNREDRVWRGLPGSLTQGCVVVVPGFQGIDRENNITTLGRGGSDTTAVALATALDADICEIYTDVEGVYTTDPSICSDAQNAQEDKLR